MFDDLFAVLLYKLLFQITLLVTTLVHALREEYTLRKRKNNSSSGLCRKK